MRGSAAVFLATMAFFSVATSHCSGQRPSPVSGLTSIGPVTFTEHLLADSYQYAFGLSVADLDGDGDLDLTSQDIRGKPDTRSSLYWFENNGQGQFQRQTVWDGEPGWFERHVAGDVSGDGKPDLLVVNNRDGHVILFENRLHTSERRWSRHVVTTKAPRAYDVAIADFDGDGDADAAVAGYASSLISIYENRGPETWDNEWPQSKVDQKMPEARTIAVGDFNRDGRMDLLAAAVGAENIPLGEPSGSQLAWYENQGRTADGSGNIQMKKHNIDQTTRGPIQGHPADVDRDGDLDVVMAFGMRAAVVSPDQHHIAWYENNQNQDGREREWKRHMIGSLVSAFEATATDMDGDGDIDVIATAWSKGDQLVWYENSGDPRAEWRSHTIRKNWKAANQVIAADLDKDGRPDIVASADNGSARIDHKGANEVRWWRNNGPTQAK